MATIPETRTVRILATILGVVLLVGGVSKLAGQAMQVTHFAGWGLPHWFLLLTGTFETAGGALLIVPATTPLGSLVLSTIMVGAVWTHAAHAEWPDVLPVVILLLLLMYVFRATRRRAIRLLGGA